MHLTRVKSCWFRSQSAESWLLPHRFVPTSNTVRALDTAAYISVEQIVNYAWFCTSIHGHRALRLGISPCCLQASRHQCAGRSSIQPRDAKSGNARTWAAVCLLSCPHLNILTDLKRRCTGSNVFDMMEGACALVRNDGFEPWINGVLGKCKIPHRRSPVSGLCHRLDKKAH